LPTTDAIKQLANQELSKRAYMSRDVLARGNVMPPADRGAFGVTGALTDYGTGMLDAGSSTLGYMLDTSLADMGRDAARFGGAMVEGMVEDPLMTAVDFIPGASLAMGAYEAEQLRGQALEAERAGQFDLAKSLRSQAGAILAMNAIPGGRTARRGAKMDMSPDQSSMRELLAESFPKDYGQNIVEPYVGAGVDPRTFSAGSGSTGKPRTSDIERNLGTQIQYGDQRIQTIPEVNLEDYEGYPFMSSISDTSGAGDIIQSINGVPVNVSRRGGQDYMFDPLSNDFVWASARNVVKGAGENPPPGSLFGRALALKERTGRDPLFIPHSMTPTGSDFSQVADVMLSYAKNNMNKSTVSKLDKDIKSIIPEWPGLADDSMSQVLNRAGGSERKKIINLLDKNYIDKGSLTAGQGRLAISDESQRIIRPGTLRNVGIVDTSRAPIVGDPHPVYNTGLYGSGIGRLSQPLSVYELNPAAAYLGGITPEQIMFPPRSTGSQGGLRSLEGSPLTGIITEDILRQMEMRRAMAE